MKILSRENFNDLNEAVIGIQRNGYHLDDLSETEFQNVIKYLILLSGNSTVCESHIKKTLLNHKLVSESKFDKINFNDLIIESLNEGDYMDMIDTGVKTAAATATVGAVGLGAYISFLFKKKKIRKAMDKLKDSRIEKADVDKETYDEIQALKPKLTKEEGDKKIADIEKKKTEAKSELDGFDSKIKTERDDLKSQKSDVIADIKAIDSNEGGEGSEETTTKEKNVKEAEEEKKEETKGTGKLHVAKADLENAKNSEEAAVQKQKNLNKKEKDAIAKDNEKIAASNKSTKDKKKAQEKNSKKLKDISAKNKELEDKGTGEIEKAKQKVDKVKSDLESQKANLQKIKTRLRDLMNPETIAKEKEAIKDKAKGFDDEIEQVKMDMKPTGSAQEFKDAEEAGKKKKEQIQKDIEVLQREVDRVSGTATDDSGDVKSSSLMGKATGFSTKFVKKLRGEQDAEVMAHEKDLLQQMEDSRKAKMKADQIKAAQDKSKDADKELDDEKKKVDASDKEKQEAEEKVKAKEQQQAVEDEKKENEAKDAKKKAIQAQIDTLKKKVSDAEIKVQSVAGKSPDKVKKADYKLKTFKDKLKGAEAAYSKLGEHFTVKYKLALLESELRTFALEYDIVLEDRKELKEEQPATVKDVPTDQEEEMKEKPKHSEEGKKVVIVNTLGTNHSGLEGMKGVIVKGFEEGEREPEGDLPRRTGDPEIFKIKLDDPKDPMYTHVNLTKKHFKELKKGDDGIKKVEESNRSDFRSKFYAAINENNKK